MNNFIWSDHNLHDPGITLLEHLAYAISDLSYRLGFNMEDLLAESGASKETKAFFSAADILPQGPLTLLDYRKLLLNEPGVKNAWVKALDKPRPPLRTGSDQYDEVMLMIAEKEEENKTMYLNGAYTVEIERSDPEKPLSTTAIRQLLAANRNLGEDFQNIRVLEPENIAITLEVETESHVLLQPLFDTIAADLRQWVSPQIRFYTLQEMLQRGKQSDDIFQGPLLENGFLDDDELRKFEKRTALRASDILHRVMDIKEVKVVRQVEMGVMGTDGAASVVQTQYLSLRDNYAPRLKKLQVDFFVNGKQIDTISKEINADTFSDQGVTESEDNTAATNLPPVNDRYRDPGHYFSITHDFPLNYGIGPAGLPAGATPERQAQARQLKAYLAFFEQILANHFEQLENVKTLFSIENNQWTSNSAQSVAGEDGIRVFGELLVEPEHYPTRMANQWDDFTSKTERFLRLTKHLLARFGEDWPEPPNLEDVKQALPVSISLMPSAGGQAHPAFPPMDTPNLPTPQARLHLLWRKIEQQRSFLLDYVTMGIRRGLAYNYHDPQGAFNPENNSGLEKRLSCLLGMPRFNPDPYSKIRIEYYQEVDTDPLDEFRFRVREKASGKILLSSSMHYHDVGQARLELELALSRANHDAAYQLAETNENPKRYYFNIKRTDGEVIARRIEYFKTSQKRREAINYLKKVCSGIEKLNCFYLLEHSLIGPRPRDTQAIFKPRWDLSKEMNCISNGTGKHIECTCPNHNLITGELIWIFSPESLSGQSVVRAISSDQFIIENKDPEPIIGQLFIAYWVRNSEKDLFDRWSLQLSFVFPRNPKNIRENDLKHFHTYVENLVKSETPAHLMPRVHWLAPDKMARFESNYLALREKLPKNLNYYREMAALNEILNISNVRLAPAPEVYLAIKNQGDYIALPEGSIVPYSTDRSELTICFWAKLEKVVQDSAPFISLMDSGGKDLIKIEFRPNRVIFSCGTARLVMPIKLRNFYGKWVHWTFVNRRRNDLPHHIGIYVNGVERALLQNAGVIPESPVANQILIGNWDANAKGISQMCIADLRIWNLMWPDTLIQVEMNHWLTIAANAPYRHWRLDGDIKDTTGKYAVKLFNCEWMKS